MTKNYVRWSNDRPSFCHFRFGDKPSNVILDLGSNGMGFFGRVFFLLNPKLWARLQTASSGAAEP